MEAPLTLNNAYVVRKLLIFVFLETLFLSKSTLGCYIVKTTTSVALNDGPYER